MITNTTRVAGPYSGTGLQTVFPFSFKVFQASDLLVLLTDPTGNNTTLTLTSQYSVSLNSNQDSNPGGSVTLTSAPATGYLVTVGSQLPALQNTDLTNAGSFYPSAVNNALDYLTILVQQLGAKLGNALQLPISVSGVSTNLPNPVSLALIGWNAAGTALQNYAGTAGVYVSSFMSSVVAAGSAAAARLGIGAAASGANNDITSMTALASVSGNPAFTGNPTGQNHAVGDNSTNLATTADIATAIGQVPSVRQTVLQGVTSSSGYANMMSAGTGLALNLAATATPMRTAFAQGAADYITTLSADVTGVVSGLAANNTFYISQDYVSPSSATWGKTLAPPQYGYSYNRTAQALLHLNGTAGSTTFLDDFGNTWSAIGGARLQTNQFKFGGSALGGAGASNALNGTSDYVSTDFTWLGNGSWSLRAWAYATALPTSGNISVIAIATNSTGYGAFLYILNSGGSIKFTMSLSSTGTSADIASNVQGTTTPTTGTWYFVELTFDATAGAYRLYVNGVQEATVTSTAKICPIVRIQVGGGVINSNPAYLAGYIDEFEFLPYCDHPAGTTYSVPVAAPSVAAAGYASDFFSIANMTMYQVSAASSAAGTNPAFTAKNRVYVGEAVTGGAAVSSVVNYALKGRYDSGRFTIAASTAYNRAHNLGVEPNIVSSFGAVVNGAPLNQWRNVISGSDYGAYLCAIDRKNATLATQTVPQIVIGTGSVGVAAEAVVRCSRGW